MKKYTWKTTALLCPWCTRGNVISKSDARSSLMFCEEGCGYRALLYRKEMTKVELNEVYGRNGIYGKTK